MRLLPAALLLLVTHSAANAQTIQLEPGLWRVSTDMYFDFEMAGERHIEPVTTEAVSECWETEKDTTVGPALLDELDFCEPGETVWTDFGMQSIMTCDLEGIIMDGKLDVMVSADRKLLAGNLSMRAEEALISVNANGVIFARYTGACPAQ